MFAISGKIKKSRKDVDTWISDVCSSQELMLEGKIAKIEQKKQQLKASYNELRANGVGELRLYVLRCNFEECVKKIKALKHQEKTLTQELDAMLEECKAIPVNDQGRQQADVQTLADDWNAMSSAARRGLFSSADQPLYKECHLSFMALGGLLHAPAADTDAASSAASPMSLTN